MNVVETVLSRQSDKKNIHYHGRGGSGISRSINELRKRISNIGTQLESCGIASGEKVIVIASNRIVAMEAILSICSIGAVAVPLSPQLGRSALREIVDRMMPSACFSDARLDADLIVSLNRLCKVFVSD